MEVGMRSALSKAQLLTFLPAIGWALGCTGTGGDGGGLSAPSSLTAAPMGGGVHLTWQDNAANEDAFEIERSDGNSTFGKLDSVPFDSASYHDSAVTFGITYTYRVRARLAMIYSPYSNEAAADPGASTGGSTGSGGSGGSATGSGGVGGSGVGGGTTGGQGGRGGAGGTGGTGGGGGTAGPDAGTVVVSFRNDVAPVLVQTCGSTTSGCHNSDQAVGRIMPQYGPCKVIWFSSVDGPVGATFTSGPNVGKPTGCPDLGLYDRLLQLHSMLCEGSTWSQRARYVVPFDLQASLLYQVIAGDPTMGGKCSANGMPVAKMPKIDPVVLPNGASLTPNDILKIRDWIMQGAPNN
jgi:hypothetical protein